MRTRRQVLAAAGAALAAVALGPRGARAAKKGRERKAFLFRVTALGFELGLSGKAVLEEWTKNDRERVTVEVRSASADAGTELDVYAVNPTNSKEPVFLGVLTLVPDGGNRTRGELVRRNFDGDVLPDGLSPVLDVERLFVTLAGDGLALVLDTDQGGGGGGGGGDENEIDLVPTPAGTNKQVTGKALTEVNGERQRFRVQVESTKLKAGNFLLVRFSTGGGGMNLVAGAFPLTSAGPNRVKGEIEFDTQDGALPPGADPVTNIVGVTVSQVNNGKVLLTGVF